MVATVTTASRPRRAAPAGSHFSGLRRSGLVSGLLSGLSGALTGALLLAAPAAAQGQPDGGATLPWLASYWAEPTDGVINVLVTASSVVEVDGNVYQGLIGNTVVEEGPRSAIFRDSGNSFLGITAVNQSAGNVNNQGNVVAIALTPNGALQLIDGAAVMELSGNTLTTAGARDAQITGSFNDFVGIGQLNQTAGSLNQQLNMVVLGIGANIGPGTLLLGNATLSNIGIDDNVLIQDPGNPAPTQTFSNSFEGFTGIGQVTQTAGHLNRVGNVLGVSVVTVP